MPDGINHRAFSSGDVLLSRGLSPYYHRGCSVSLPCSEWERVVPLRDNHQREEDFRLAIFEFRFRRSFPRNLWRPRLGFQRTDLQSTFANRKSKISPIL